MLFFGHVALSLALADATDADPAWALAGNLLPDVTDKTGGWLLKVMPSGRWLAHGLPFFAAVNLVARRRLSPRASRGFLVGYGSHLVGDLWAGGRLPLTAPFGQWPRRDARFDGEWLSANLLPEALGLAFLIWRQRRRANDAQ